MTLGVLGPFCILLHSNFHLGSFNSTVALVCMLIVAGSGFIGRFFYTNIHYGLYGEKIRLGQVIKDFGVVKNEILALRVSDKQKSAVDKLFEQINSVAQKQSQGISLWSLGSERRKVRKLSRTLKNIVQQLENQHKTTDTSTASVRKVKSALDRDIPRLLSVLRRLPGLQLFERLFALWHVLHIPFFILMVLTAITHIVVVHMY